MRKLRIDQYHSWRFHIDSTLFPKTPCHRSRICLISVSRHCGACAEELLRRATCQSTAMISVGSNCRAQHALAHCCSDSYQSRICTGDANTRLARGERRPFATRRIDPSALPV
jgi:hypothetical protein